MNPEFTWSFSFPSFSSKTLDFNEKSLLNFSKELEKLQSYPDPIKLSALKTIMKLRAVDKGWISNASQDMSPFQKPSNVWFDWKGSVKLRNYLFIMASIPKNLKELLQFLELEQDCNLQDGIDQLYDDFLISSFWMDLMKCRAASYWIDCSNSKDLNLQLLVEELCIQEAFATVFYEYGGNVLDYSSFWSHNLPDLLFDYYHPRTIKLDSSQAIFRGNRKFRTHHESHIPRSLKSKSSVSWKLESTSISDSIFYPRTELQILSTNYDLFAEIGTFLGFALEMSFKTNAEFISYAASSSNLPSAITFLMNIALKTKAVLIYRCSLKKLALQPISSFLCRIYYISEEDYSLMTLNQLQVSNIPLKDTTIWFQNQWNEDLKRFLNSGTIRPSTSSFIEKACLGVWKLSEAQLALSPPSRAKVIGRKAISTSNTIFTCKDTSPGEAPDMGLEQFSTLSDFFNKMKFLYSAVLFEKVQIFVLILVYSTSFC